jgi:hypothetical protein
VQINFRDAQGTEQFAVFQISSTMPATLAELLKIRVPVADRPLGAVQPPAPAAETSAPRIAAAPERAIAFSGQQ